MPGTTREQAMAALFAALTPPAIPGLVTCSRRLTNPEALAPAVTPALFLVMHEESYHRDVSNHPPTRSLMALALIYNDVGTDPNAIPETAVNNLLDAIDAALAPQPISGLQTLGGLVAHAYIDGQVIRASGDISGKTLAKVPIRIVMP